jgi:surface polysaccharide O-acyltransferase-like enzyme
LVFIYSVALFVACKNYFSKKIKNITDNTKNVLIKLSNLTFGVYLVHVSILNLLTSINKHLSIPSFILEIIILYIGTTILSFIICYIISKIKYLNKLITL